MRNKKKAVVITFAFLTLLLAVLAVVISVRLIQDQRPTDSDAATCSTDPECTAGPGDRGCATGANAGFRLNCIALNCGTDNKDVHYKRQYIADPSCGDQPGPTTSTTASTPGQTQPLFRYKVVGGENLLQICKGTCGTESNWIAYDSTANNNIHCDILNDAWSYYQCNGICNGNGNGCPGTGNPLSSSAENISKQDALNRINGLRNQCIQAIAQIDCAKFIGGKKQPGYALQQGGISKLCSNPNQCNGTTPTPSTPTTTTTSQPPANVCRALRRVDPNSTTLIDASTDTSYTVANGTQMRFRARYTCQNGLRDRFKLLVFPAGNQAGVVGNPVPPVSWNPAISVVNEGNDSCLYFFDWQATGLVAGTTYRIRIVNVGADGVWNSGDDIEGEPDCRKNLLLAAETSSSSTPTSTSTPSSTSTTISSSSSSEASTTSTTTTQPPVCGEPCGSNGMVCTGNNSCVNNVCVSNQCLNNPNGCQADRCTPKVLPSTGLFDEGYGPLLLGGLLVLFGILLNRYNFVLRSLGYDQLAIRIFGNTEETYASGVEKSIRQGKKKKKE